jgi:photosynthetic reaction center cytochrome c subunit
LSFSLFKFGQLLVASPGKAQSGRENCNGQQKYFQRRRIVLKSWGENFCHNMGTGIMTTAERNPGKIWFLGVAFAAPQAAPAAQGTSDQVFKNVRVLKGIPVDDFMGTMGVMSAALGFDCSECHIGAGTEKVDWAADTAKKGTARRMVLMMAAINRDNFGGQQMVTCWSCHHGRDHPATTPALENVYGPGSQEMDDVLTQMPLQPAPGTIIDKYLQAIGGTERLAGLKSYIAKGASVSFGGFGGGGKVQIYGKFPDQRTTHIDFPEARERGESVRAFNGHEGWLETPLAVLTDYQLTGGELDGARLDAELSFPGQIKQVLTKLRVSMPITISDLPGPSSQTANQSSVIAVGQDRLVNVVQGVSAQGTLVTLYFDQESGLLVRMVRYAKSPIGRVPTQVDYADYRDVDGIKIPFRLLFAWLDGRDAIQLSEIQTNVPIDEAKFGRPVPPKGH